MLFQTPTLLDYGEVLQSLLPMQCRTAHLFSYICELSLLFSPLTVPGPARLASATLLLTRALHNYGKFFNTSVLLLFFFPFLCSVISVFCSIIGYPLFGMSLSHWKRCPTPPPSILNLKCCPEWGKHTAHACL